METLEEQHDFIDRFIHNEEDLFIYQQCLEGIIDIDRVLDRFIGLEPQMEELHERAKEIVPEFMKTNLCSDLRTYPRPIRYLMHRLDKPGIFDSLTRTIRGESISAYKDYGLISLVKNPFCLNNEDYWIVLVAGVHGPGTALGLKLLSNKQTFSDHPYGGVYEVRIDRFTNFFEKFQQSRARWETPPYEENAFMPKDFELTATKVFLSGPAPKDDDQQMKFDENLINLFQKIFLNLGHKLEMEGPYTLPLGGKPDFWQAIFEFQKDCDFVIHDVTTFALGVMVEIGFSIGSRKRHFLIWNMKKAPFTNLEKKAGITLLQAENIDWINIDDLEATQETLANKIVKQAYANSQFPMCSHCFDLPEKTNRQAAFMYCHQKELSDCLKGQIEERSIYRIVAQDTSVDNRICHICQSLRISNYAIIELSEQIPDSFIVLGMAKAIGVKTLLLSRDHYNRKAFPWAQDVVLYQHDNIAERLSTPLRQFF